LTDHHLLSATGGVILKITYGYDVQDSNDPLVAIAEAAVGGFSQASVPGAWLVDIFPVRESDNQLMVNFLLSHTTPQVRYVPDWMPGATFKVKAAEWRDVHMQLLNVPFNMVREQMVSTSCVYMVNMLNPRHEARGKARPSFLKELLEDPEVCSDSEKLDIVKWGAASLYAAASDTVGGSRGSPGIIT
jgi:hypothetical protein